MKKLTLPWKEYDGSYTLFEIALNFELQGRPITIRFLERKTVILFLPHESGCHDKFSGKGRNNVQGRTRSDMKKHNETFYVFEARLI